MPAVWPSGDGLLVRDVYARAVPVRVCCVVGRTEQGAVLGDVQEASI